MFTRYAVRITLVSMLPISSVCGQTTFAELSGGWSTASTWSTGFVPDPFFDSVIIGNSGTLGGAISANVSLSQDTSVAVAVLGEGAGSTGIVNLGSHIFTCNYDLILASSGGLPGSVPPAGAAMIQRTTGTLIVNGSIVVTENTLNLAASDRTGRLSLQSNSTASTSHANNIARDIEVFGGSTLNLGSHIDVTGVISIGGMGSRIVANNFNITSDQLFLNWSSGTTATITNRGKITANGVFVANLPFTIRSTDTISSYFHDNGTLTIQTGVNLNLLRLNAASTSIPTGSSVAYATLDSSSSLTTTTANSITGVLSILAGSSVTLNANLNVPGTVSILHNGSFLNAQNQSITAAAIYIGASQESGEIFSQGTALLVNRGPVIAGNVYIGNQNFSMTTADNIGQLSMINGNAIVGNNVNLGFLRIKNSNNSRIKPGSSIGLIQIDGNSLAVVEDSPGNTLGLTLTNPSVSGLMIAPGSTLRLQVNGTAGYSFRWANPSQGDHIADINAMITSGQLDFDLSNSGSFSIYSDAGYTYVGTPVPEPTYLLMISGIAVLAIRGCRKQLATLTHSTSQVRS